MGLHDKLFGNTPKTNDLTDEEKSKAALAKEVEESFAQTNVNEFTDLKMLDGDVIAGEGQVDPVALLTGKEGARIRKVPFSTTYNGLIYDVHGTYLDYDKDQENVEQVLRAMIVAFTEKLEEITPHERGVPLDLDDPQKRTQHQAEYNAREWFIVGCMALTHGCGIMINFSDRTKKNNEGLVEYSPIDIPSYDKAPFSFIIQQILGPTATASSQYGDYMSRVKFVMSIIHELSKIMAEVSYASVVVGTVIKLYNKYQHQHEFLNACVENGLTELIEPAKQTLLRVYGCLNTEMVNQWETAYHRPSEHFTISEEAKLRYEMRLERNLMMFRSVLLTALVVSSPKEEKNSLVDKAVNYAQFERWVYANLHNRRPEDIKVETASIMQRTIRDYWYGNSQYTKFVTDALLPLGYIPNIPTKYGDIDPMTFNFDSFFSGMSEEQLEEYSISTDDFLIGSSNADTFRAEHAEIELRRQEELKERQAMNRTPEEVLQEDRKDNGYLRELGALSNIFGTPVYGKVSENGKNAELMHGLTTSSYEESDSGYYFYNRNRIVGALNPETQEININPLNDQAVEWLRRSKLVPTKFSKLAGNEVFVVEGNLMREFYPRDINFDIMTSADWREIIERSMVPEVGGWRFNHHIPETNLPLLEGNWELREGNHRIKSEDVSDFNAISLEDHIDGCDRRLRGNNFIGNLGLFADYDPTDEDDYPCHLYTRPWGGYSLVGKLNHDFEASTIMRLAATLNKEGAIKRVLIGGREFLAIRSDVAAAREFVAGPVQLRLPDTDVDMSASENHWWVFGCTYSKRFQNPTLVVVDLYLRTKVVIGDEEVEINTTTDLPDNNVEAVVDGVIKIDDLYAAFEELEDNSEAVGLDDTRTKVGAATVTKLFSAEDNPNSTGFNTAFTAEVHNLVMLAGEREFSNVGDDNAYCYILGGITYALNKAYGNEVDAKEHDTYGEVILGVMKGELNPEIMNWLDKSFLAEIKAVLTAFDLADSVEFGDLTVGEVAANLGEQLMELVTPQVMMEINNIISLRLVRILTSLHVPPTIDGVIGDVGKAKLKELGITGTDNLDEGDYAYSEANCILLDYKHDMNRDLDSITVNSDLDATIDRLLDNTDTSQFPIYLLDGETGNLYNAVDTKRHGRLYVRYDV